MLCVFILSIKMMVYAVSNSLDWSQLALYTEVAVSDRWWYFAKLLLCYANTMTTTTIEKSKSNGNLLLVARADFFMLERLWLVSVPKSLSIWAHQLNKSDYHLKFLLNFWLPIWFLPTQWNSALRLINLCQSLNSWQYGDKYLWNIHRIFWAMCICSKYMFCVLLCVRILVFSWYP